MSCQNLPERKDKALHHIAIIFGTRPEAIKLASVARAIEKDPNIKTTLINTGQHDTLMPTIMRQFGVTIDQNLHVLEPGQPLGVLGGKLLTVLTKTLEDLKPDLVVVQGDTLSAQMGAMAAFYLGIPIGHVEAGLRTYNTLSPFPEESSRRVISLMATLHFAATSGAEANLKHERVSGLIEVTGNPVVDALTRILNQITVSPKGNKDFRIVATIHRRENHPYLDKIFGALADLADDQETEVLISVHANPVIRASANRVLASSHVNTIEPLDYIEWLSLMQTADLLISDSGGIQEEAPVLGIPLLIARDMTERPEVVDSGHAYLVGHDRAKITSMARAAKAGTLPFSAAGSPFGEGDAGERIAHAISRYLSNAVAMEVIS